MFGAAKTVIDPAISLEVQPDGSVEPYMPGSIRFRDGLRIRPVCPFLELWARINGDFQPLTGELLELAEIDVSQLHFKIIAANLKARRQTGDSSCAFEARLEVRANDHRSHDLWAWSHTDGAHPLVTRDRPIWLGSFLVVRPVPRKNRFGVCTDTIRVRFTPGRGAVYGQPSAISGQCSGSRRRHQIVPEANRILNPSATWCTYNPNRSTFPFPLPPDVYDGNGDIDTGDDCAGVVDDTCDAVITASLTTDFESPKTIGRVLVGPPHYSPDRRHLFSFADDLADRDPDSVSHHSELTPPEWLTAVSDLFRRIWETASTVNLERHRQGNLAFNQGFSNLPGFPEIHDKSMTRDDSVGKDRLMSDRFLLLADKDAGDGANDAPLLPKAECARTRHGELSIPKVLVEFMVENRERLREILRPPFRRMSDADVAEKDLQPGDFRDALILRSYRHDARMPPFLRDCDFAPLSLSRHQWDLVFARNQNGLLMDQAYEMLKK